ncbi:MAG: hypothetical protein ACFCUG_12110 [Thiotrichales bacterium]
MYFLRWITSHPILTIVLVTLLYALFNIQNLGHWFGGESKSVQVAKVEDSQAGAEATAAGAGEAAVTASAETSAISSEVAAPTPTAQGDTATGATAESAAPAAGEAQPAVASVPTAETEAAPVVAAATEQPKSLFDFFRKSQAPATTADQAPTAAEVKATVTTDAEKVSTAVATEAAAAAETVTAPAAIEVAAAPPDEVAPEVAPQAAAVSAEVGTNATATPAEPSVETTAAAVAPDSAPIEQAVAAAESSSKSWLDFLKRDKSDASAPAAADTPAVKDAAVETAPSAVAVETTTAPTSAEAVPGEAGVGVSVATDQYAAAAPATPDTAAAAAAVTTATATTDTPPVAGAPAAVNQERRTQLVQTLLEARQSFWKRDFTTAETIYRNLVAAEPENADVLGEFGNMLVQAGKAPEALDYYEQAANLLIEQNRLRDVHPLVGFIGHLDRERAAAIIEKIRALPRQ